ncbi:hypothetical protein [Streptomyces sp. SID3343]|uniref:hypothetical protein n=1 Tax=Streptomyces sp. SID3343 TaxID=2690260 RepID=UPI001370ED62|nr:hypothetical protein [Streptomyces sp. SID3343]MYW04464.1 hypothetical protein [Streptomyces sp. SID3343]
MPHVPKRAQPVDPPSRSARLDRGRRAGLILKTATDKARIHALVEFGEWLVLAAPSRGQAHTEWYQAGAAWLRPGHLWTAVTVPAHLIHAAVDRPSPQECAPLLARALDGGPLFYRPPGAGRGPAYTALLRVSEGRLWEEPGTRACSPRAMVLVPAPGVCAPAGDERPWWVVPGGKSRWCSSVPLAELVAAGRTAGGGLGG